MKKNYKAWDINFNDFNDQKATFDKLSFLIKFAVLAPSSHNNQPWKFSIKENSILIYPDNSRWLSVSDPDRRYFFVSLGCALENILIAADLYGLPTEVKYLPKGEGDIAARIDFEFPKKINDKQANKKHLAFSIPKRCVNRSKYSDKKIPQYLIDQIKSFSDKDVEVSLVSDRETKEKMSKIMLDSRVKSFDNKLFREEMAKYKKNNWTHSPVGITGATMGFSTPMSFIASFVIKHINVIKIIRKKEEVLLEKHTPLLVFINIKEDTKQNWLKSGRIFERCLLTARQHNVQTAISALSSDLEKKQIKEILNTEYFPQILFRAGYTDKAFPHSPRLQEKEVIINNL